MDDTQGLGQSKHEHRHEISNGTVHRAFEHVVDSHPDLVAIVHDKAQLTYRQVDIAANRLANHLIQSGLRPKQSVCLVAQRSLELVIAILAILKAGSRYVPIDGGVVSETALQHMLKDTEARFILCLPRYWDRVRQHAPLGAIILELGVETGAFYSATRPTISVAADDSLYVMYTSGSTGVPKGVDVKHRAMTNALLREPGKLHVGPGSKVAQVLSISFAMGGWEMLVSLMNGGTLYLRTSDWCATLKEIDTLICTPSILSKYDQKDFANIKTIAVAGEPCSQALADSWINGRIFYNFLGSTEVFLASAHRHVTGKALTIGQPLPNVRCYVLNDSGDPVPRGEKGTLWVGGAGVSRGYLNLPLTTAERYKSDRFSNDGSLMYNFGNIVAWRPDGELDSFGRMDDQVKIKGFRVELDGVTAVIEQFDSISQATSVIIDDVLYGFYASTSPIDEGRLDAFVRKHLPYYSVPEQWRRIDTIPLNINGKIDKSKLKSWVKEIVQSAIDPEGGSKIHTRNDSAVGDMHKTKVVLPVSTIAPTMSLPSLTTSQEELDLEKGNVDTSIQDHRLETKGQELVPASLSPQLPQTMRSSIETWIRYRGLITYRWFLILIVLANCGVACWLLYHYIQRKTYPLSAVATATAANLTAAVLIRSEPVINLLFIIFSSVPLWMPLIVRRACAQVYHLGGIHSGCALAAVIWFMIFTVGASLELPKDTRALSLASIILSYVITALLLLMSFLSYPTIRAKYHNTWEKVHRYGGWTILILYWVLIGLATKDLNVGSPLSKSEAYLRNPAIWLLAIATAAIIFPWLFLRRVPVRSEVLSSHAIRLHFDYTNLDPGQGVRLAERPLGDWHGFATITNLDERQEKGIRGFSVIVSRAGDFTGRTIDNAPTHIWKRGIPTCGVLRIATLFKSVVLVATGSGIGPCLSIFPFDVKMRILWTAPSHEATFGKEIVDEVRSRDSRAIIHDTRKQGKPDMALLAYQLYQESNAEAVLVISNKRFTTHIVYEMERRGIPAYGAIFDS